MSWILWKLVGYAGQIMFTMRFLVQWIASEKAGKSITPKSFWYLSIGGNVLLLAYAAFYLRDEIITIGQLFGSIVYVRNLMLIEREALARSADVRDEAPAGA